MDLAHSKVNPTFNKIYQITPILIGFKDRICDQQIPRLFPLLICNFFHLSSQTKQLLNSIPQIPALPQIPVSNPLAKHTIKEFKNFLYFL
jgi:hypothetical protein